MGRSNHYQDERRWHYENVAFHRDRGRKPYRRWSGRQRYSERVYATVIAILALFGAISLGGIFVVLVSSITKR